MADGGQALDGSSLGDPGGEDALGVMEDEVEGVDRRLEGEEHDCKEDFRQEGHILISRRTDCNQCRYVD